MRCNHIERNIWMILSQARILSTSNTERFLFVFYLLLVKTHVNLYMCYNAVLNIKMWSPHALLSFNTKLKSTLLLWIFKSCAKILLLVINMVMSQIAVDIILFMTYILTNLKKSFSLCILYIYVSDIVWVFLFS